MPSVPRAVLTADFLRAHLSYDQETGLFTRIARVSGRGQGDKDLVGKIAGDLCPSTGYWRISLAGNRYLAHRLAWLYMTGDWPDE